LIKRLALKVFAVFGQSLLSARFQFAGEPEIAVAR
jgi:hypothetical protein